MHPADDTIGLHTHELRHDCKTHTYTSCFLAPYCSPGVLKRLGASDAKRGKARESLGEAGSVADVAAAFGRYFSGETTVLPWCVGWGGVDTE